MHCEVSSPQVTFDEPTVMVVEVEGVERWMVRDRLQSLGYTVKCTMGEALRVEIAHAPAAMQFWAVMQVYRQSRSDLAARLEQCWSVRIPK